MVYAFASLILAMVTGLAAHAYYGTEGLIDQGWVDQLSFSIIGAGMVMTGLSWLRCAVCRRGESSDGDRLARLSICSARGCRDS